MSGPAWWGFRTNKKKPPKQAGKVIISFAVDESVIGQEYPPSLTLWFNYPRKPYDLDFIPVMATFPDQHTEQLKMSPCEDVDGNSWIELHRYTSGY